MERSSPFLKSVCSYRTKMNKYATLLSMSLSRSLGTGEGKTLRRVKKVASGEWAQRFACGVGDDGGRGLSPRWPL